MKRLIIKGIIFILTFFFIIGVRCEEKKESFFGTKSINSIPLVDSILSNPNILEQLVLDTNYFRIDSGDLLNKNYYVTNLIEFLKTNNFEKYKIEEFRVYGHIDIDGVISELLVFDIISIKTRRKIIIKLNIIQPEEKWKIKSIIIY